MPNYLRPAAALCNYFCCRAPLLSSADVRQGLNHRDVRIVLLAQSSHLSSSFGHQMSQLATLLFQMREVRLHVTELAQLALATLPGGG